MIALVALPAAAAAQAEAPPPEPPPPPKKLSVGTEGLFNPSLLLQGWFTYDHADDTTTSFRVRRAEIHVRGEILPKQVAYEIFIDPARAVEVSNQTLTDSGGDTVTVRQTTGNLTILQDFYVTYLTDYADVSIGQFKIPVSLEGTTSAAKLYFPERALVAGTFGDKRDIGLRLTKKFDKLMYMAELVNGAGQNLRDNTNEKDASLRLEIYPIEGLTIAGATYDTVGDRDKAGTKDRWEGDLRYEKGPILLQGEFIRARDVAADGADAALGQGFYGMAGFKLATIAGQEVEPLVRVGQLDPNTDSDSDNDETWVYEGCLDYYIRGHEAKVQLSFSRFDYKDDRTDNNELIFASQVWF
ncbi:MAG TPA: porin [Kofleriaceae bacterium]|nr:porin [Kofleriaceae bacterium]